MNPTNPNATRRLQSDLDGFIRESVASMREETARLATEVLATIDGSENGVHQRTINRLTTFIDSFRTLNFAGDQQLTDVLRHEWAHALADRRPRLVEGKRFRNVFGAAYHSPHSVWEYDPDLHLTRYAAAMPETRHQRRAVGDEYPLHPTTLPLLTDHSALQPPSTIHNPPSTIYDP